MTRLSRLAVALACLVLAAAGAFAVERPAAGHGAFFVDDVGQLNFFLVDLDGDLLQAIFPGDAGDFARQAPDGRQYMHAEAAEASLFVELTSGATFHGSGTFQLSMFVECTAFNPASHIFNCFFPGPGSALLDSRGTVTSDTTGDPFTLAAHLAAFYIKQPQAGGPALYLANVMQDDIKVTP